MTNETKKAVGFRLNRPLRSDPKQSEAQFQALDAVLKLANTRDCTVETFQHKDGTLRTKLSFSDPTNGSLNELDFTQDEDGCLLSFRQTNIPVLLAETSEEEVLKNISANIAMLLEEKKISQREFAHRIGATEAAVCRYVRGERMPRINILVNISDALDVSIDALVRPHLTVDQD